MPKPPAPSAVDKKPEPAKKPATKPAIVPKNEIEAKVVKKVLEEGLPIDKDKKDFSESQARRTNELESDIVKSAKAILEYETAIKNWPETKKGSETAAKEAKKTVRAQEGLLDDLIIDEMKARDILSQM